MPESTTAQTLTDTRIHVKFKLAALWTATMFLYVYGDYFSLYLPNKIQKLMDGNSGVGATTPVLLLGFSVMMTIPSLMIGLSVLLPSRLNRWANIIAGIVFTLIMTLILVSQAQAMNPWAMFYAYLAVVEIALTSIITWLAWKWEREA